MKSILVCVLIAIVGVSPANTARATLLDRTRMSVEIAGYIRDVGKSNEFKTKFVELGAAAIEGNWALADWRSEDGKQRGQASFAYLCDHWNLEKVKIGHPLHAQDLVGHRLGGAPVAFAEKLVADLKLLETQHIAYLKPAHSEVGC